MKLELLVIVLIVPLIYGDENSTTISTSSVASSTTIQVSTSTQATTTVNSLNETKPAKLPSNRTQQLNTTSYTCNCDLTLNCDVNCCCDLDCTDGIIQAFKCDDGVEIDDYFHGEGLERCEINNGWFCIASSRTGAADYYLKAPLHTTFRWPKLSSSKPDLEPLHDHYKFGDPIMTYDTKAETLDTIKIPASLSGSTCRITQPIKFLVAKTSNCLKSVGSICTYNNNLIRQLLTSQLFRRPSKMTETREASDVLSINVRSCKHTFVNCTQITLNEDGAVEASELMGDELFDEIRMEFVINDTTISSLLVTLLPHDDIICVGDELEQVKIVHTVDIRFKNENENREKRIRMKSRGYNEEELILSSRYRPVNESSVDGEWTFDYFNDTKNLDFHLKLPESVDGKCVLNENLHDLIRFNENSRTFCNVELTRDDKNLNETFCQQFQRQIIHFLFSTMNLTENYTRDNYASDIFVSKFWSPSFDVATWTRVDVQNTPPWSPEMRESEKILSCTNIATSISYSIFSSRVRASQTKKYERVIEGVTVEFGLVEELKFSIDDENSTAKVEIQVQVQFFDVREKSSKNKAKSFIIDVNCIVISSLVALTSFA